MIIGLTGTIAAGKSAVVEHLKKRGFEHYVYSDILREEAKKRGIEETRENLQKLGNEMKRKAKNLGILSKKLLDKVKGDRAIFDGIRTPDEIKELRKNKDVKIIGITASQKLRFKRLMKRNRVGDPKTFGEFKIIDNHENRGKTKGQNINECIKLADHVVMNNGSIDELKKKIDKLLSFE